MFKSVYSKFIAIFLSMVLCAFLVLALILTALWANYTMNSRHEQVANGALAFSNYIQSDYEDNNMRSFNQYVFYKKKHIEHVARVFCSDNATDTWVIICDAQGAILFSNLWSDYYEKSVSGDFIDAVIEKDGTAHISNFDGLFEQKMLVCGYRIIGKDPQLGGALFVCSDASFISGILEGMIEILLYAMLGVMLATFAAVYVISRRVVDPLKRISAAAKSFALGNFDIRLPVRGNNEIAELAQAFNNMAESLGVSEEMQRSFLANVSHELRTPMTTIAGFCDSMLCGAIPKESFEHYLQIISSEVKRLSRLITSLLDITRMQAGERKMSPSVFDICETARLILISFENKIDRKHLEVEFVCDRDNTYVYADKDAVHQVIYNLCENAIKFSREGGVLKIEIVIKDKKVYCSVYNEGQGIPQGDMPFVFDRFYKTDKSHGLDKSGVGLGLYIVKTLIDAHGEEIWVKSKFGEYCEFVFSLPHSRLGSISTEGDE